MTDPATVFVHVRVVIGIIIGLGITHLLRHVARIVEHPHRQRTWWVHLAWALATFLYMIGFWWWELGLESIEHWSVPIYLFLILYAVLLYLQCALLFPEDIADYDGYQDYFMSRRRWFFGMVAALYAVDLLDSWVKGSAHLHALGGVYLVRGALFVVLALVAMRTRNLRFHAAFAVLAVISQVAFVLRYYYAE